MQRVFFTFFILCFCNCSSNTGTGIIAGVTLGGGSGGLAGGGSGALIGSAVGAIGAGLIGAYLDEQDRRVMEKASPRTVDRMDRGDPLTLNDIIKLTHADVSDDTIIIYMQNTGSTYNLSQSQIRRLQDVGVSQNVIDYMIKTGE
ncbi:MAG TPA: hypothetical protein VGO47_03220 [Chlamydiales bacterium]|jgi:uncharacterized protein YcfJ|nr:hypothetical protein [Chlamydiales bacterium]